MHFTVRNRWHAFGIHLLVSALLFVALASIIYFLWYPGILFRHDGGLEGIKLIAGVDFIIGPVLTLLVYKLGKPSLKFDLGCIAFLQALCLAGGMWTVWQTRPVAVVYAAGEFRSIPYQVYRDYGVNPDEREILGSDWPVWLATRLSPEEQERAHHPQFKRVLTDSKIFFMVDRYEVLDTVFESVKSKSLDLKEVQADPGVTLPETLAYAETVRFFPAALGAGSGYIAMDMQTREAVDFIPSMSREKSLIQRLQHLKITTMELIHRLM